MLRQWRRFISDRRGNVAMLAAGGMAVVLGAAALGIDLGSIYDQQRRAQSAADLAALAAAADLPRAARAAAATVQMNRITLSAPLGVELGTYRADASIAAAERFVPATASGANAARVTLKTATPLFFGRAFLGSDHLALTAKATATQTAFAAFALGSRLAALDGGILNAVLGASLGINLSLSAMDYQALASTEIDLPAYLGAIASRARLDAATYDDVLASNVGVADAVAALADAGAAGAAPAATAALAALSGAAAGGAQMLPLGSLADFGPYDTLALGTAPSPSITVSALDLLSAMASIADGTHQVAADLDLGLPGIASASLALAVGERPQATSWITVGPQGATVRTAQTRLLLTVSLLGGDQVGAVTLPLYLDLAAAKATLDALSCADSAGRPAVELAVTPSVVDAWIGQIPPAAFADLETPVVPNPATLVKLPLITVSGEAHAALANQSPTAVDFTAAEIAAATRKTVSTTDFSSLLTTLLGGLDLSAAIGGLSMPVPGPTGAAVQSLTAAAAPAIDTLVGGVLTALGVGLGQADVWATGLRCDGAVLVN